MDIVPILFGTIGGLALFLFGLRTLSDGLKKVAGDKFRHLLGRITGNPLKGCLVGAFTTSVMQSSSLTMVTLIGLINAGLLNLSQGIGVMLGSEIGTTITAQLIVFKIGVYYLPVIAFGFFLSLLAKDRTYKSIGQTILGFGILFLGMNIMSTSIKPLQSEAAFVDFLVRLGKVPIFGVIVGMVFTGILQSSSALTGLVISMGMNNLISLNAAIAIIIGANIGTCFTGLFASMGSSLSSKRLVLAQVIINIAGVAIFFPFLSYFAAVVEMTSSDLARQIANSHTLFNIIVTAIMLPLTGSLVVIVGKLLPGTEQKVYRGTKFIDRKLLNTPSVALSQADKEVGRISEMTCEMLEKATKAILEDDCRLVEIVIEEETVVDQLHEDIHKFLDAIPTESLSRSELRRLACLTHAINDIERVGDHANNLVELAERKQQERLPFSEAALEELKEMSQTTNLAYETALATLMDDNKELVQKVRDLESKTDVLQKRFETNHVKRLEKKVCHPVSGIIFVEILRNLERVADHSNNIANTVQLGF
jgi:phosphate:Na+ symporter